MDQGKDTKWWKYEHMQSLQTEKSIYKILTKYLLYHEENPQNEKCKASHIIIFYSICFYFIIRTNYMVGLWKRGTCT